MRQRHFRNTNSVLFDRYSVVDALRNDYYSAELTECPPALVFHALTEAEMEQRKRFIIRHEVSHALGMPHNAECGNIEFGQAALVHPTPFTFPSINIDQIRLVPEP